MKRVFKLFVFIFVVIFLSGCGMFREYESQKKLHEIVPTTYFTQDGQLVVSAKNDTGIAVKMTFVIYFYDKNEKEIENKQEILEVVRANDEVAIGISQPENLSTYKVTLDVSKIQKKDDILFKLEENDNKKNVIVNFANNNDFIINHLNVSVAYYYKNEMIGLTNKIVNDIEANRTTEITMNHPVFKNGKKLMYDSYKIFINDLYYETK